jgi:uncharacterized damage-inducible protein DinB
MQRLVCLAAMIAATLLAAPAAAAQLSGVNNELLRDWIEMKRTLIALAEAMPEERFSYKPTPEQRDFGQQVLHVATANVINLNFLRGKAAAPAIDRTATAKAAAIKAMADSFDYGEALLREQTDQSMFETVQTNQFLGPSSRARVVYFLLGHSWDIYGQMVVYLRLNGRVPPASQRP